MQEKSKLEIKNRILARIKSKTTEENKTSILMLYTGGTIGMQVDISDGTLKPFDLSQITNAVPELQEFACDIHSYTFDPLIDSSDVEPALWKETARIIDKEYDNYDGFVVLHGTDTMAYSASVLSFMLGDLTKPVVFTGSQLPIGIPRTDGKENLISAVEIASAKHDDGTAVVPEVCIYFNSLLIRGNRARKINSEDFDAFRSPNCLPLARAGINIKYNKELILHPKEQNKKPEIFTDLDTSVSILKIHPGITPQVVKNIVCGPKTRAVIIETYGAGNAPTTPWFLDIMKEADKMGKIIVNVTQCLNGRVNMEIYATGKTLEKTGVVSGYDSTTESMLGKLFYLLGKSKEKDWIKAMIQKNLRGEITN